MTAIEPKAPYKLPTFHNWSPQASFYHPLQAGSIDGTDIFPHDKGVLRAMLSRYKPNKNVTGDQNKTLFVGRLSKDTSQETIQDIFENFGELEKCRLVRDFVTGFSRGYAFVEFKRKRDALVAASETHKITVDGKEIFVDFECERTLEGWKPRRFGGGFGGRKESGQLRFGGIDRPFKRPLPSQVEHLPRRLEQEWKHDRNSHRQEEKQGYRDHSGHDRDRKDRERHKDRDRDRGRKRDRRDRDDERGRGRERDQGTDREKGRDRSKDRDRDRSRRDKDTYRDKKRRDRYTEDNERSREEFSDRTSTSHHQDFRRYRDDT